MQKDLKPAICILNPDDVYNLQKNYPEGSYYCITPHQALELQEKGVLFPSSPHLQEGLVLTKEINGNGYYFRTDAEDCRIINERCLAIEAILSYLGGKEFRYSENSSFRSSNDTDTHVEVGVDFKNKGGGKSATDVDTGTEIGQTGEKTVVAMWSGKYTHSGYLRAVELARINGLSSDPAISALLEQRTPTHPNPIDSQEYHVNVTADLDKNVHVLEDLNANIKGKISGNLKVDVSTSRKMSQTSTVDFFVSFGPIPIEETKETKVIEEVKPSRPKWVVPVIISSAIALIAGALALLLI